MYSTALSDKQRCKHARVSFHPLSFVLSSVTVMVIALTENNYVSITATDNNMVSLWWQI